MTAAVLPSQARSAGIAAPCPAAERPPARLPRGKAPVCCLTPPMCAIYCEEVVTICKEVFSVSGSNFDLRNDIRTGYELL